MSSVGCLENVTDQFVVVCNFRFNLNFVMVCNFCFSQFCRGMQFLFQSQFGHGMQFLFHSEVVYMGKLISGIFWVKNIN